jgi:hypothetical protein
VGRDRTGLPAAALLPVVGIGYALLPGPNVTLDPEIILTFVLPPLLYSAALNSSLLAIRRNLRTVVSLAPIVRMLGLRANDADRARLRNEARSASVEAALRPTGTPVST